MLLLLLCTMWNGRTKRFFFVVVKLVLCLFIVNRRIPNKILYRMQREDKSSSSCWCLIIWNMEYFNIKRIYIKFLIEFICKSLVDQCTECVPRFLSQNCIFVEVLFIYLFIFVAWIFAAVGICIWKLVFMLCVFVWEVFRLPYILMIYSTVYSTYL